MKDAKVIENGLCIGSETFTQDQVSYVRDAYDAHTEHIVKCYECEEWESLGYGTELNPKREAEAFAEIDCGLNTEQFAMLWNYFEGIALQKAMAVC